MRVTICDVGPRDGLQNEPETLPTAVRAELVNRLAAAHLPRIEAASFVRPDAVPQMADAEDVVSGIDRSDGTEYSGLALNVKGYERLAATGLDRVNFTLAATDAFNRRNANQARAEARASAAEVLARSHPQVTSTTRAAGGSRGRSTGQAPGPGTEPPPGTIPAPARSPPPSSANSKPTGESRGGRSTWCRSSTRCRCPAPHAAPRPSARPSRSGTGPG